MYVLVRSHGIWKCSAHSAVLSSLQSSAPRDFSETESPACLISSGSRWAPRVSRLKNRHDFDVQIDISQSGELLNLIPYGGTLMTLVLGKCCHKLIPKS